MSGNVYLEDNEIQEILRWHQNSGPPLRAKLRAALSTDCDPMLLPDEEEDYVSCPVNDPDCTGGEGDCHDACEPPDSDTDSDALPEIASKGTWSHGTCMPREGE